MRYLAMEAAAGEIVVLPPAPLGEPQRGARRRRSWTVEQKLAIVKEAAASGDPGAVLARRHDMNANHLFNLIQQAQDWTLGGRRSEPPGPGEIDFIELGRRGGGDGVGRGGGHRDRVVRRGSGAGDPASGCRSLEPGAWGDEGRAVIQVAPGTRVYLACHPISMRKGFDGLAAEVANILKVDPFSGGLFIFRSKRGDYFKILYWDGSGLCLFAKRLEKDRFVWPRTADVRLKLTPAQLGLLIEGINWRQTVAPEAPAQRRVL